MFCFLFTPNIFLRWIFFSFHPLHKALLLYYTAFISGETERGRQRERERERETEREGDGEIKR